MIKETFTKHNHQVYPDQVIDERLEQLKNEKLRVWYGVRRLNKIAKQKSIIVIFENSRNGDFEKNEKKVKMYMDIAYMRYQTFEEKTDAAFKLRVFHTFELYIDKKFKGDFELALEHNSLSDQNHVELEERDVIKNKLRSLIGSKYKMYSTETIRGQLRFEFNRKEQL